MFPLQSRESLAPVQLGGEVNVQAPLERVWEMIFDVETMRRVVGRVPGITLTRLDQTDDVTYELTCVVGVAAVRGKYDGKITVLDKIPPSHVRINGEGHGGGNRTVGEVLVDLREEDGHTVMAYSGQGSLTGPLAGFGQRLVDTVGRQFIDQGARVFAQEIEQGMVPAMEEHEEAPSPYGRVFQAVVIFILLATIAAIVIIRTAQAIPAPTP